MLFREGREGGERKNRVERGKILRKTVTKREREKEGKRREKGRRENPVEKEID